MTEETKIKERWSKYREANINFPHVRDSELTKFSEYINAQKGEVIVEVGTGSGILTFPLAKAVGKTGKVYSFDYEKENLDNVAKRNKERLNITLILQEENPQTDDYKFPLDDNISDKVAGIATLHHYDDRSKNTGTSGRQEIIKEFYRILKKGGRLILADVADNTNPQRYFDNCGDNPKSLAYCHPNGHPHDFLDEETANKLFQTAGFKNITFKIEKTPWRFEDEEQAKMFLNTLHNSKCSPDESLEMAKKYLPFKKTDEWVELGWELFYLTAEK